MYVCVRVCKGFCYFIRELHMKVIWPHKYLHGFASIMGWMLPKKKNNFFLSLFYVRKRKQEKTISFKLNKSKKQIFQEIYTMYDGEIIAFHRERERFGEIESLLKLLTYSLVRWWCSCWKCDCHCKYKFKFMQTD